MKKLAAAILAVLYISTSTGATVHVHYCMGKLAEWGLGQKESDTCGSCGMKSGEAKETGCCKDEQKFFKNNTDKRIPDAGLPLIKLVATNPVPAFIVDFSFITSISEAKRLGNAPLRCSWVAVYILNRTFLI